MIKPSEAQGVFTETLDPRFDNMEDSYRARLLDAMKAEDKILSRYIEKAQLDRWYAATLEAAEMTVTRELDEITRAAAEAETSQEDGNIGKKREFRPRRNGHPKKGSPLESIESEELDDDFDRVGP
jgi:hypothetical protein